MSVTILHNTVRYWPDVVLGRGSFSCVYKGERIVDALAVAVKLVDRSRCAHKVFRMLQSEISILQGLGHPNIVRLLDSAITDTQVILVLEQCMHGTLDEWIREKSMLDVGSIQTIMIQLASALVYMHRNAILHRDIKPANILMHSRQPPVIKLADFGFARQMSQDMTSTYCGSPLYMAPEVLTGASYNTMTDIWSTGVVAYQCLTGSLPYNAISINQLREMHRKTSTQLVYPPNADANLINFISLLLQLDPGQRIDSVTMSKHPFLTTKSLKSSVAVPSVSSSPPLNSSAPPVLSASYVLVDRDHVIVNQLADRARQPAAGMATSALRARLMLLEAVRDAMAFYQGTPISEMVVAAQMLRLLKETVAMATSGSRADLGRFRALFDECTDRISTLRTQLQPANGPGPPPADNLLYQFSLEQGRLAAQASTDIDTAAKCYTKSISIQEYLKTRTSTHNDSAHLAQSIRASEHQLANLRCARYCGMCGTAFTHRNHRYCQSCGELRSVNCGELQ